MSLVLLSLIKREVSSDYLVSSPIRWKYSNQTLPKFESCLTEGKPPDCVSSRLSVSLTEINSDQKLNQRRNETKEASSWWRIINSQGGSFLNSYDSALFHMCVCGCVSFFQNRHRSDNQVNNRKVQVLIDRK